MVPLAGRWKRERFQVDVIASSTILTSDLNLLITSSEHQGHKITTQMLYAIRRILREHLYFCFDLVCEQKNLYLLLFFLLDSDIQKLNEVLTSSLVYDLKV
jgi:hypothetical protein